MPMKGKYFRIDERVADEFDDWCARRRWINQGALFEALLRYAMAASPETLVALLEGKPTPENRPIPEGRPNSAANDISSPATSDDVPAERRKAKPQRRSAKGRG